MHTDGDDHGATTSSASILVGTASWTDKTLLACGRFYPKEARTAEARLRHYASQLALSMDGGRSVAEIANAASTDNVCVTRGIGSPGC
jgi:hypothetical protein